MRSEFLRRMVAAVEDGAVILAHVVEEAEQVFARHLLGFGYRRLAQEAGFVTLG